MHNHVGVLTGGEIGHRLALLSKNVWWNYPFSVNRPMHFEDLLEGFIKYRIEVRAEHFGAFGIPDGEKAPAEARPLPVPGGGRLQLCSIKVFLVCDERIEARVVWQSAEPAGW